jgi:methyl-accepting chemotaxis protein
VVQAMERMRELVQSSTSGSTELAASSDQMSKMSRGLLDSMDRFALRNERSNDNGAARGAAAGLR